MSVHASRADLIDLDSIPTTHASTQATAFLSQLDRKKTRRRHHRPHLRRRRPRRPARDPEPITLYGEGPGDRRDRLRELLGARDEVAAEDEDTAMGEAEADADVEEEFYTAGSDGLLEARREIARFSLPRAKASVDAQKLEAKIPLRTHVTFRAALRVEDGAV
ncbi:hypothetical protein VE04_05911 [Pseudogymnoascus sp. 24MN13]|nr:hypothetical protein VE04_05911 [Pseudogymnoascus sp. 24MN13]